MKKIMFLFCLFCSTCFSATHVGSVSNVWPNYATDAELAALQSEFDQLISTNGITAEYADVHYLAITWSNSVLNAQVTASNAVPTNNAVYTQTVALAASALQSEVLWIAASNKVVYTNTTVYTNAVALAGSSVQTNDVRYLAAITNNQESVTLGVTTATASNNPTDYYQFLIAISNLQRQINMISAGSYQTYLSSSPIVIPWITPTNKTFEACSNQTTTATNFTYTYTATNTYGFASVCTNRVFTNLNAGTASVIIFSYETGAGSITEKVELYAYQISSTNQIELGDDAVPQAVPTVAGDYRVFSVPYDSLSDTNGFYVGFKTKCISKGVGSDVIQLLGDGYNTHVEWGFILTQ